MARKQAARKAFTPTRPDVEITPTTLQQEAIHPHWNSVLLFSQPGQRVRHLHHGSHGTFERSGNDVTVHWDDYPADHFVDIDGLLVHQTLLGAVKDINNVRAARIGTHLFRLTRVHARVPGTTYDVELRLFTSDIPIFHQVFAARDYDADCLPEHAGTIIDLGANIGLASVFFGLRYRQARILAVEPDPDNFALLARNTAGLWPRVMAREAAAWIEDGTVSLRREDAAGQPLGAWGVQVTAAGGAPATAASCTMPTLMRTADMPSIDILKCDIEGAEADLFAADTSAWLPKVGLLIIETHEGLRPGSEAAIRAALAPLFDELPARGENFYFRRRTAATR